MYFELVALQKLKFHLNGNFLFLNFSEIRYFYQEEKDEFDLWWPLMVHDGLDTYPCFPCSSSCAQPLWWRRPAIRRLTLIRSCSAFCKTDPVNSDSYTKHAVLIYLYLARNLSVLKIVQQDNVFSWLQHFPCQV